MRGLVRGGIGGEQSGDLSTAFGGEKKPQVLTPKNVPCPQP